MSASPSRRRLAGLAVSAAIISQAGLSRPARAQVKIRYAGAANAQYHGNATMQSFWDDIAKRTNGEVQFETFWGTRGGEQALLQNVALGTLDGYQGAYTGMREFDLFYMAQLFRDYDHAVKVINGPLRAKLQAQLEAKYKVHLIGVGRAGSFGLSMKEKPNSWADLRNKKVRGGQIEGVIESIKALGANAVPMAFNEVYGALQQGVVDGQVNLNTLMLTQKYYEVIKFWVRQEFGLGFDKVVIAQRVWARIKPEHQRLITDGFVEWERTNWWPHVRTQLESDFKKWEEFNGAGSVINLDAAEQARLLRPRAEQLAEEIFGAGTWKQVQETA
jgi:TRAP-type C4-dicarboxylate transport system substrate-binding protein